MSSINYEDSGYGLNLDLVTILYQSHVSYPRISGVAMENHSRPIYLKLMAPCKLKCEKLEDPWSPSGTIEGLSTSNKP